MKYNHVMHVKIREKSLAYIALIKSKRKLIQKCRTNSSRRFEVGKDCQVANLSTIYQVFFNEVVEGTYVEVGANNGISVSNTWCLAKLGWKGHLIEPISQFAIKAEDNYRAFPNTLIHNHAIGAPSESKIQINRSGLLSSARAEVQNEFKGLAWAAKEISPDFVDVPCMSLDIFLESHRINPNFELLVVDVEGYEKQVFDGFSIQKWKPQMLIVELSDLHPDLHALSKEHGELFLEIMKYGYVPIYKDSINTVFVDFPIYNSKVISNVTDWS